METLFRETINEKISSSNFIKNLTKRIYDKSIFEKNLVFEDKNLVKDYTNEKLCNIIYSPNETIIDITNRLRRQAVLQKFNCEKYAVAVVTELFTNYIIDVMLKCKGIILYYNSIPVIFLLNSNLNNDLIITYDMFYLQKDLDEIGGKVESFIKTSVDDNILKGEENSTEQEIYFETFQMITQNIIQIMTIFALISFSVMAFRK